MSKGETYWFCCRMTSVMPLPIMASVSIVPTVQPISAKLLLNNCNEKNVRKGQKSEVDGICRLPFRLMLCVRSFRLCNSRTQSNLWPAHRMRLSWLCPPLNRWFWFPSMRRPIAAAHRYGNSWWIFCPLIWWTLSRIRPNREYARNAHEMLLWQMLRHKSILWCNLWCSIWTRLNRHYH